MLENAVAFLRAQKPDVITLQEVTAGRENFCADKELDVFLFLKNELGLNGAFAKSHAVIGDPRSRIGNAVLTRGKVMAHRTIWLKEYAEVPPHDERDHTRDPHNTLDCLIGFGNVRFRALSAHLAWSQEPVDTPEKIRQAEVLARHLQSLGHEPYILGGDFNLPRGTKTLALIESVSRNLAADPRWGITRSTHPVIHKIASFKPDGLLVDFIFASPHFSPLSVDAPVVDASDHLPIRATLEIE